MFKAIKKSIQFGAHTLTLETGEIARQADGAVLVSYGDTAVLVTVVGRHDVKEGQDFFPLTVDYQEKTYAAGKIPGGFFKREARPSEKETLTSRLIDRPLRPLFPESFYNEIQIVAMVVSSDSEIDSDIPAIIGASAALAISGIPFYGPIGAARVGYINEEYVTNPTASQLKESELDLVVAATDSAVLMVESEAKELPESVMLGAVLHGHKEMQAVIKMINELAKEVGKEPWDWVAPEPDKALIKKIHDLAAKDVHAAFQIKSKGERSAKLDEIKNKVFAKLITEDTDTAETNKIKNEFFNLEAKTVRTQILDGEPRIDGRDTRTVRPIAIRSSVLPRTHGSALFTRGETQALVVATLGTGRDEQTIDALQGEYSDRFMLHYNMPPYATGETGRVGTPKRREIGHGRLAKRALIAVLPSKEDFSYTMRVVSEITESNGSSSMASVCGGCLALMDAGVPIKAHVAGIAMGLIKEGNRVAVLTDILGDEDHLGDMDFKVCGTADGITACQMDIKIKGLSRELLIAALNQAKAGRLHILGEMMKTLSAPRTDIKPHAPRIEQLVIDTEFIGAIIGPGGKVIQEIQKTTGTVITIEERDNKGYVAVSAANKASIDAAMGRIKGIVQQPEIGEVYEAVVKSIMPYGAFMEFMPGKQGLLHISEVSHKRLENLDGIFKENDVIKVKLLGIDNKTGKFKLSRKVLMEKEGEA